MRAVFFRRRSLIWLACFAWLAQFCLPLAQAAASSRQVLSDGLWCGPGSAALHSQFAELPAELRAALDPLAQSSSASFCALHCAATSPAAPPPVFTALPSPGALSAPVVDHADDEHLGAALAPVARGPPQLS